MSELKQILDLWKRASAADSRGSAQDICLATVVAIEGSAYRRPGARMLLTASAQRAGTISGGCLEAEVAKKAWWLTEQGPSIQRYSSFFDDDGDMPYGLGCGGTVIVLLERGVAANQTLASLQRSVEERTESVIVTSVSQDAPGTVLILNHAGKALYARDSDPNVTAMAGEALRSGKSSHVGDYFVELIAPPPALTIFGAGDDTLPLLEFTATLGWHVTVADDRSNLARPERFPHAAVVQNLDAALAQVAAPEQAAVIMTHSYEQDRKVLHTLLAREMKYIGILGPRRRTERLLSDVAPALELTPAECLARLHTPVGLDLGGHSPAAIALAIAAELQAVFAGREARKLPSAPALHA
ncbi:MAG TPA: XdhC family protein [Acidobacteriaceae bacterium]|jgi:xanthine/CO dehydrogenase XdhC/CoxF family maturation factor|nr:XdhC family protein [Acidobacteriaceae bacterium]